MSGPLAVHRFAAADGVSLAWREIGEGRAVVLLHGLFSNAVTNWIRFGHAAAIAARGFRVIMPDLRGHGDSAAPHDAAAYPPDILSADGAALVRHLGLADYDLGGYSLGGRTVLRMLVAGARPRRAVLAGMGLQGVLEPNARVDHFRAVLTGIGSHRRGSPEWMAEAFLKTTGADPAAMLPLLGSFVATDRAALAAVAAPVLVVTGAEDGRQRLGRGAGRRAAERPLRRRAGQSYERGDPARPRRRDRGLPRRLTLSRWRGFAGGMNHPPCEAVVRMIAYFQPLLTWLGEQNAGKTCGW